ncbi:DNA methyltransferase [Candidatus Thiosymbion oneisti]|uniref:DNA methyltransferase n=1 Tax=Candidatus Thiosymbion oneisti TaxID=589554 RepID=UPI000B7EC3EB|nr:DNA methyltransferase [Candidatus Thiosymbion oneisti]
MTECIICREEKTSFSDESMPFDRPLDRTYLDIDDKRRANLLTWRGQFSPQFAHAILASYAHKNDVVLDPFVGSGTVLVESAHLGHEAFGYEVNPAAELLAKVYTFTVYNRRERLSLISSTDSYLSTYIPLGLPLFEPIGADSNDDVSITPLISSLTKLDNRDVRTLIEALIVKLDLRDKSISAEFFWSKWNELRSLVESLPQSGKTVSVTLGDARYLPLDDSVIDFVLTSPPYINVFNYHHNYRSSVEMLGWKPLVSAKSEIGANRKFRQNRFLTVVQYCIDMSQSLSELVRVCCDSGRIIFVVGRESNVHKTAFFNGAILRRLAEEVIGMRTALRQERQFQNKFGNIIKEDILHFIPKGVIQPESSLVISHARRIGEEVLSDARKTVPEDKHESLEDAISRVQDIKPSPQFVPSQAKE